MRPGLEKLLQPILQILSVRNAEEPIESNNSNIEDNDITIEEDETTIDENAVEEETSLSDSFDDTIELDSTNYTAFHTELEKALQEVSEGNLSARIDPETVPDEVREIAVEFNEMLNVFTETITELEGYSDQVTGATEQVRSQSDNVKEKSKEMSDQFETIVEQSKTQNKKLQELSSEIRSLSATTEEVASSANEVAELSETAAENGKDGRELGTDALAELDEIDTRTQSTVDKTKQLNKQINNIKDVAEFISDVAEQTNILALNASIEAARAGEEGDGFAVVAEEVKSLAEDTDEAAKDIKEEVEEIEEQSSETVEEMNRTKESIKQGTDTIEDAIEKFQDIADSIEETNNGIQEISNATEDQATSLQEASKMIEEVTELSEETETKTEDCSTAAQRQTTSLSKITTNVNTLEERSSELQDITESFSTQDNSTTGDTTTIEFWHAMSGSKGVLLETLIQEFEEKHPSIQITAKSKGSYRGTFESVLSTQNPPEITQIYEIGTERAIQSNKFVPVQDILPSSVNLSTYLDSITSYYTYNNKLQSMPFNSSVPILAINREAFKESNIDSTTLPQTFDTIKDTARKITKRTNCTYGITFANYSWFVEQWFATDAQNLVNNDNGRSGKPTKALLDSETGRSLYEWWTQMDEDGLYKNPGIEAREKAKELFYSGESAMLIDSSSSLSEIKSNTNFTVDVGEMPADGTKEGLIVGGGSLWVSKDISPEKKQAIGTFLTWLTQPEQQIKWHKETGYLPVTQTTIKQLEQQEWFTEHPEYKVALQQLVNSPNTPATNGARIDAFNTVRTLISEAYTDIKTGDTEQELQNLNKKIEREF